jgi:hypothetical protein
MTADIRAAITARLADWNNIPPTAALPPVSRSAVAEALEPVVRALIADELSDIAGDVEDGSWIAARASYIREGDPQ